MSSICAECGHGEAAHRFYSRCVGTVNQPDCRCLRSPENMTCDACPFAGCPSCEYAGGTTVSVTYGARSETIEEPLNEATPAGNGGLTNKTVEES